MCKWQKTVRFARTDETLRLLAVAIREANKRREPDPAAHMAFRDRAAEIGVTVPNVAYWSILLVAVLPK